MTPVIQEEQIQENAPNDFSEIMELTAEEKQELLKMWKEAYK